MLTVASKVKQTLCDLKGAQGTLRIYSLQAQDKNAKVAYKEALKASDEIIEDLKKRIKTLELEEPQYKDK